MDSISITSMIINFAGRKEKENGYKVNLYSKKRKKTNFEQKATKNKRNDTNNIVVVGRSAHFALIFYVHEQTRNKSRFGTTNVLS